MKRWLKFIATAALTVLCVTLLNTRVGLVPPLGKFFDPFHGFWQNSRDENFASLEKLQLAGLRDEVTVVWDKRMVPHIFAKNNHDLYFTQGYATARLRLWQMEIQTHVAAGRLAEILGPSQVSHDRFRRATGMLEAARRTQKALENDEQAREIVLAYTAGVNAYIASLDSKDYPLEYKIFDYAPEPWTPLKCSLLLKYMAWDLSARGSDREMSNLLDKYGKEAVAELFPDYGDDIDPIAPKDTPWQFAALQLPPAPQDLFRATPGEVLRYHRPRPRGSNNWAVSGSKTAGGYPLLANDPHLRMTLPSIWCEMQLIGPDVNVYGVTIPGAPGIIIGFNEHISWGVTNVGLDVYDWYEVQFKDDSFQEYKYDGTWRKIERVVEEEIKIRDSEKLILPIVYTHHGPVVSASAEGPSYALRWLAHDPSNELKSFYDLNRAKNYDEYFQAISQYNCPAQNFAFADVNGDIALWSNGKFPLRWGQQGKFISDGSDPKHDWQGWIPREQNPHSKNPSRGFVSSANQHLAAADYPYPLPGKYASYRGRRINQVLAAKDKLTPDDMRLLQNDNKNLHAESILPFMLDKLALDKLSPDHRRIYDELAAWDYNNDADKIAPSFFDHWWRLLHNVIWEEKFGDSQRFTEPSWHTTTQLLLHKPDSKWFDIAIDGKPQSLEQLIFNTFTAAHYRITEKYGPMGEKWQWGHYAGADLRHLSRIPGLGRSNLFVGGGKYIVNATNKTAGPSWRMVVSLGPQIEAWGIYPGGQSGNPGSRHYDDFVGTWAKGELAKLWFIKSLDELDGEQTLATWIMGE